MNGRRAGNTVRRTGASVAASSGTAAKRAGKSARKSISKGAESLTQGAKRQARDAGDWIAMSSRSGMKRMGKKCLNNPVKCTTAMALAGYTAVNLVENSKAQQECITKCLPLNWPAVVESNGEIAPEYFVHDPKPVSTGSQENEENGQPQCMDGTDCEPYCIAACKAEHPTTLLGAAMEGAGEMMDDVIVPFAEDVLGLPISDLGGGLMWGIRIAVFVAGALVIFKVGGLLGLWGATRKSSGGGHVGISLRIPASAPAPAPQLSDSQVQLANRGMAVAERNPKLARMGMQVMQQTRIG